MTTVTNRDSTEWVEKEVLMEVEFDTTLEQQQQNNLPVIIKDEEDVQPVNTITEFLKYHHKFGHCLPKQIQ